MFNKSIAPFIAIFIFIAVMIGIFGDTLNRHGFDSKVLGAGNLLIFIVTAASVYFLSKGLKAATTAQFLQYTYISILLKLFVCCIAAFAYIFTHRSHINKRALFGCMALYLLYTFVERRLIIKHSKDRKNEDKASA